MASKRSKSLMRIRHTIFIGVVFGILSCGNQKQPVILMDQNIPCAIVWNVGSYPDAEAALNAFADGVISDSDMYYRTLAVMELRHYLAQMRGEEETRIAMADDRTLLNGNIILVGIPSEGSAYEQERREILKRWRKTKSLHPQRMRFDWLREKEHNILVISGRTPLATLYAVYDWLESQGVHWPAPGYQGEIIPTNPTILISADESYKEPAMVWRGYTPSCNRDDRWHLDTTLLRWMLRNRLNIAYVSAEGDSLLHMYGIKSCRNLKFMDEIITREEKLCFGQSESLQVMIDRLLRSETSPPDVFLCDASAIQQWCDCEFCVRIGNDIDKSLAFLALVADRMANLLASGFFPHECKIIGVVGASLPQNPLPNHFPCHMIDLAVNMFPRCYNHSLPDARCTEVNYHNLQVLDFWLKEKKIRRLGVIEGYHARTFAGMPMALADCMGQDLPFYQDIGVDFVVVPQPDFYHSGINGLIDYQLARQSWQPQVYANDLLNEYVSVYYAAAPPSVLRFYHMLQEALANIVAWRFELPQILHDLALTNFNGPLVLNRFRRHFSFYGPLDDENFGTDWQRTYQLIHDARHILEEIWSESMPPQTNDHLLLVDEQLRFAEMTITLYDNIIRVLTLSEDEPVMREEAAIRLRLTMQKMAAWVLSYHPCGRISALEASGIQEPCQKLALLLDRQYGPVDVRDFD